MLTQLYKTQIVNNNNIENAIRLVNFIKVYQVRSNFKFLIHFINCILKMIFCRKEGLGRLKS